VRLNKRDVAHIATFKEGAFKSWADIMDEVKARRVEVDTTSIREASRSLALTFD
jgi:hypothetical protein